MTSDTQPLHHQDPPTVWLLAGVTSTVCAWTWYFLSIPHSTARKLGHLLLCLPARKSSDKKKPSTNHPQKVTQTALQILTTLFFLLH